MIKVTIPLKYDYFISLVIIRNKSMGLECKFDKDTFNKKFYSTKPSNIVLITDKFTLYRFSWVHRVPSFLTQSITKLNYLVGYNEITWLVQNAQLNLNLSRM